MFHGRLKYASVVLGVVFLLALVGRTVPIPTTIDKAMGVKSEAVVNIKVDRYLVPREISFLGQFPPLEGIRTDPHVRETPLSEFLSTEGRGYAQSFRINAAFSKALQREVFAFSIGKKIKELDLNLYGVRPVVTYPNVFLAEDAEHYYWILVVTDSLDVDIYEHTNIILMTSKFDMPNSVTVFYSSRETSDRASYIDVLRRIGELGISKENLGVLCSVGIVSFDQTAMSAFQHDCEEERKR